MKLVLFLLLIVPGIACLYAIVLRPLLHRIPALAKFYADADGFWATAWAVCGKSITLAWGYTLAGLGWMLEAIDPLAAALGDPSFKDQVTSVLQGNPKIVGYVMIAISAITIAARMRSLGKTA